MKAKPRKPGFEAVKAAALASIDAVLSRWLPGGKRKAREYLARNPRRADAHPGSFSVNLDSAKWADFATGDKGGDLVSLVAYLDGVRQAEARDRLAEFLGLEGEARPAPAPAPANSEPKASKAPDWRPLLPVPEDAPPPPKMHPKHGRPSRRWEYPDAAGRLLGLILRFDPKGERKQILPLTFCEGPRGRREWRFQALPVPRPLYGLDRLAAKPAARVIVTEGEKACDAAAGLFPDAVCVTWPGGSQAVAKADWLRLAGRACILWPDHDAPGREAMARVAAWLRGIGAASVKIINPQAFERRPMKGKGGAWALGEPRELAAGWDAADAVAEGWTAEMLAARLRFPDAFLDPEAEASERAPAALGAKKAEGAKSPGADAGERRPRFQMLESGPYANLLTRGGEPLPPKLVCARFMPLAMVRDERGGESGLLVEVSDMDGAPHRVVIPHRDTLGEGMPALARLAHFGLLPRKGADSLLVEFLRDQRTRDRARLTWRTGWHEAPGGRLVFVLPDSCIGADGEPWIFTGEELATSPFRARGTLEAWQRDIATLCRGNPLLLLAMCAAFAAPLLYFANITGFGLHYRGQSSRGKSSGHGAALSTWGPPRAAVKWHATINGLEGVGASRSDVLMVLDELKLVDPREAVSVAYLLADGIGKSRANVRGGERTRAQWRTIFLSNGEISLGEHAATAGRRVHAGAEVRLLHIAATTRKHGTFDELHGFAGGEEFAKHLERVVWEQHGTAGPEYVRRLLPERARLPAEIAAFRSSFLAANLTPGASGQASRGGAFFALLAFAGELARALGLVPWGEGEAAGAVRELFAVWLNDRGGAGLAEEREALRQVVRFFQEHSDARLLDWDRAAGRDPGTGGDAGAGKGDTHRARVQNMIGFRKFDAATQTLWFYVYANLFRDVVCQGIDAQMVLRLLAEGKILRPGEEGRHARNERLPKREADEENLPGHGKEKQRVYVLNGGALLGLNV